MSNETEDLTMAEWAIERCTIGYRIIETRAGTKGNIHFGPVPLDMVLSIIAARFAEYEAAIIPLLEKRAGLAPC